MAKKKEKNKIKNRIISMLFLIAIIIIMAISIYSVVNLIIRPTDIFVIKEGNLSCEESSIGYVIREETIIQNEDKKEKIVQIKTEGEKVAKGETIFRYQIEQEDKINNQIQEINNQIQEALEGQTELFSSDAKSLEEQIESKLKGVNEKDNIQEIKELKNDISKYITKKAKIVGNLSKSGEHINALIQQKEELEDKLFAEANYVYATEGRYIII